MFLLPTEDLSLGREGSTGVVPTGAGHSKQDTLALLNLRPLWLSTAAGAMLTLSRQMHVSSALAAGTASMAALLYLGQFAGFGDVLLSALLWGGLALCIMFAVPVFGETPSQQSHPS